ncbi:hypothetical protein HDC92_005033 [Pedobacter sp. AK017]|uniref:hypothetical protein n=1 Tax=Pedobacter sp. AK017 TaxID=2723073 RepID=UPI00161C1C47|nr:hypothetical protein [Pedobacter sp. AK017]MBB5441325.1 hypothetical protein [Pedobacter sp. AK017]
MVIKKIAVDTSINVFFDDELRVKTLFITHGSSKLNALVTFDYSVSGKTKVAVFDYDFNSTTSKLRAQFTLSNTAVVGKYIVESQTSYTSIASGILLFSNLMSSSGSGTFLNQLILASTGLTQLELAKVALTTTAGCVIGAGPLGCAIGGAIGILDILKNPSNGNIDTGSSSTDVNTTDDYRIDVPPASPEAQTENTQLQDDSFFTGGLSTTGKIAFGEGNFTVEYTNVHFAIKLNKQNHQVIEADVDATMNEIKEIKTNPVVGYPTNNHGYSLKNSSISGQTITITFNQDPISFPQNNASFTGTMTENTINGTLTFNRTSNGLACVINMKMTLKLIY